MAFSAVERFERAIVLRSARVLPLFLSAIATVLLAVALVALLYSIIPALKPSEPKPIAEPPQVSVDSRDIVSYLNKSAQATAAAETGGSGASSQSEEKPKVPGVSPEAQAIANELEVLRKRVVSLDLRWDNEYKTVCDEVIYGTCIGQKTVLSAPGAFGFVERAFARHHRPYSQIETVSAGEGRYPINASNAEVKIAIVKELEAALRSATPVNANRVLTAWAEVREQKETDRETAFQIEQQQREEQSAKAQAEYEANVERKHVIRGVSLSGIGFALAGFVSFGLVLAVLAIERHTRLLEAHLSQAKSDDRQYQFQ
jgi:hypothetical protein